jgi:hypothetical protein
MIPVTLICDEYPRFYYPKGTGFYSGHVNNILCAARSGLTADQITTLLDINLFVNDLGEILQSFSCSYKEVEEWAQEEIESGEYEWIEEEYSDKSQDEKVEKVINESDELRWWSRVGTEEDDVARAEFERNICSAKANAILNVALSTLEVDPSISKQKIKDFIIGMKDFEVRWMEELQPYIKKVE